MAYLPLRKMAHSNVITAADWNSMVHGIESTHAQVEAQKPVAVSSLPALAAIAAIAAVASASTKPISRRSLLGLWWRRS